MDSSEDKDEKLEQAKNKLYKVQNNDPNYQAALAVIKYQSQRTSALQTWNNRYREKVSLLTKEQKILLADLARERKELATNKTTLLKLVKEKARLTAERWTSFEQLREFDEKVERLKTAYDNSETGGGMSLLERVQLVLFAVKELIYPTVEIEEKIIPTPAKIIDPHEDKPWMKSDNASINRDSLGR